jgi:putative PIN family toxin of toxin-antitoxin system
MIWVSYCVNPDGIRHRVIETARRKRVRLFVSDYILDELERTLIEDLGRTRRFAMLARRAILRIARVVELPDFIPRHVPGDPDDDPIVQTALTSNADYLVTADKEILRLKKVRSVQVVMARAFAELLDL